MTKTKVPVIERDELTEKVRQLVTDAREHRRKAQLARTELFVRTYQWVEAEIALEGCIQKVAIERLARLIGVSTHSVARWYGCGALIRTHKLNWKLCKASAVDAFFCQAKGGTEATKTACIQALRQGKGPHHINALLEKDKVLRLQIATRKAEKLAKQKKLTPGRLKLEMQAVLTLAKHYYGRQDISMTLHLGEKEELRTGA